MKQPLSILRYVPKRASLIAAITLGALAPVATFAWGPDRTTYTTAHPADHVVFNSITDNPVQGDERNFMQIREASSPSSAYADSVNLKPDTDYTVFIYYHNDASSSFNGTDYKGKGVAHGAYVKADFPDYVNYKQSKINAEGYVGATGATKVFDEVYFSNTSGDNLSLSYVKGSATIHNKGKTDGMKLSDSIVTSGAKIGYDKLDGVVPGCNDYSGYVTLTVRTGSGKKTTAPSPAPANSSFSVQKDVRLKGSTAWTDTVNANPGDTVQYLITYKNTGNKAASNVVVKDTLPPGVTYVAGSGMLKNGQNPAGKSVGNYVTTAAGLNIGSYESQGVGYVYFDAKVANDIACGTTSMINSASATVGTVTERDTATVTTARTCQAAPATTTPPAVTTPEPVMTPSEPSTTTLQTTTTTTPPADTTTPATVTNTTTTTPAVTTTTTTTTDVPAPAPAPAPTPSTGPTDILGGAFGAGSLGLGVNHYLASRRALRRAGRTV